MPKRVLITGASGLVGTKLTEMLMQEGIDVIHLGRSAKKKQVPSFIWDIQHGVIDEEALKGVDAIVHLAGAGVADKRWTEKRKQEIRESRTRSTQLLVEQLKKTNHQVKTFVSASAIGYYGFEGDEVCTEASKPGSDFLASVVKDWETEIDKVQELNIRTVKIRIGIVLSKRGGALAEMAKPVRWGVGAALGTGKQYMSWIHIEDLCRMFIYALRNEQLQGAYNGVGPYWVTNKELTTAIAKVLKKPLWLPPIPGFVLNLMLGEMADLVVKGSKVSGRKIVEVGFTYTHPNLEEALTSLLSNRKPQT
ncbi:MAG: TIGR01777 family oxidoreductase [Cyclobacteriaceae bacterium]|nr:TIGR01777 family oxidoreductase [Cyclobacteriaceae bacterium]